MKRIEPINVGAGDELKILHVSSLEPWGQRRIEHGKEVGGHAICAFKIVSGDVVSYYLIEIELEFAKKLKRDRHALVQFVSDHRNLRHATHLDTVKVAT